MMTRRRRTHDRNSGTRSAASSSSSTWPRRSTRLFRSRLFRRRLFVIALTLLVSVQSTHGQSLRSPSARERRPRIDDVEDADDAAANAIPSAAAEAREGSDRPTTPAADDVLRRQPEEGDDSNNSSNEAIIIPTDKGGGRDGPGGTAIAAVHVVPSAAKTAETDNDMAMGDTGTIVDGAFDASTNADPKKMAKHLSHCEKQSLVYNDTHVKMNMSMFTAARGQQNAQKQQKMPQDGTPVPPGQQKEPTMEMSARSAAGNSAAAATGASFSTASATTATSAQQTGLCTNGYANDTTNSISYPCNKVDLLSFIPLTTMHQTITWRHGSGDGYGIGNDVWGWTHSGTGREFALMGFAYGTTVVEVTTPTNPVYLGVIPSTANQRNMWRDIKVKHDFVYVVSEQSNHGLQIFNLTRLLDLSGGADYGRVLHPDRTFNGTDWFGSAHNLVVNDNDEDSNLLIAVGTNLCDGGLFVMDLSNDPLQPEIRSCFGDDGYVHDAQCVTYDGPDSNYRGREVCFSFNEDTVTIFDVDAPNYDGGNIQIISRFDDPYQYQSPYDEKWTYTHQGWLTEDHRYLLVDDEGDEVIETQNRTTTYVLDVRDLSYPTFVGAHRADTKATDHNMYIKDGYAYQANYDAGLRILRLDNLESPQSGLVEEAYFDIEPNSDESVMKGAWSVYPYFPSGTILVSSTEEGLFMVRANLQNSNDDCRRLSSESACGSNLFTNTFANNSREYTKIKTIIRPSLPVGGSGGYYVGRLGIPSRRKRQVGAEFVDIDVNGSRSIRLVALVGLEDDVSSGNEYKFHIQVRFDTGRTVSGKVMRLGSSAHNRYKTYSRYVDVPFGARRIEKIQYKVIKPGKSGFKNILLLDKVSIEKVLRSTATATTTTTTGRAASYNTFRSVAPREDGLR